MRARSAQPIEFAWHELVESASSAVDAADDRWTRTSRVSESDRAEPGALQSLHLRERRGFGGHRHAGRHGAVLQFAEPAGQFHRAHAHPTALPPAGGGLPDQLVPPLATEEEQLPQQIRAHAGGRVPGRVVPHAEQRGLPPGADRGVRPRADRRQVALVRDQPRADLLSRLGLR